VRDLVEARDDGLTPFRLGVISGIVGGIENKIPPLAGSRIEDGYVVGAESPLRFVSSRDGSLQVAEAIEYLRRAQLLSVERSPDGMRIGLGERLKPLYPEGGEKDGPEG
jgi:hypothetical protein